MKVKVKPVKINDIKLARDIMHKIAYIASPKFDYIVDAAPDVVFSMYDGGMDLQSITFESFGCEDIIRIDEEYVILELANGMHQVLYEHEGFYDLLTSIEPGDLDNLEPEIQNAVNESREYYKRFM